MIETLLTSIIAFGATNITGQLLGIFVLVGLSVIISMVGAILDPRLIGLVGLFPIYLLKKILVIEYLL